MITEILQQKQKLTALQWLLAQPGTGRRGKQEVDRSLAEERDW